MILMTVCVWERGCSWHPPDMLLVADEARDAVNRPTMHMTAPYRKNYLGTDVSAEVEKS